MNEEAKKKIRILEIEKQKLKELVVDIMYENEKIYSEAYDLDVETNSSISSREVLMDASEEIRRLFHKHSEAEKKEQLK